MPRPVASRPMGRGVARPIKRPKKSVYTGKDSSDENFVADDDDEEESQARDLPSENESETDDETTSPEVEEELEDHTDDDCIPSPVEGHQALTFGDSGSDYDRYLESVEPQPYRPTKTTATKKNKTSSPERKKTTPVSQTRTTRTKQNKTSSVRAKQQQKSNPETSTKSTSAESKVPPRKRRSVSGGASDETVVQNRGRDNIGRAGRIGRTSYDKADKVKEDTPEEEPLGRSGHARKSLSSRHTSRQTSGQASDQLLPRDNEPSTPGSRHISRQTSGRPSDQLPPLDNESSAPGSRYTSRQISGQPSDQLPPLDNDSSALSSPASTITGIGNYNATSKPSPKGKGTSPASVESISSLNQKSAGKRKRIEMDEDKETSKNEDRKRRRKQAVSELWDLVGDDDLELDDLKSMFLTGCAALKLLYKLRSQTAKSGSR